jgi:2,3-bisphosphoglycerate-independent phosphoglycerate mutase
MSVIVIFIDGVGIGNNDPYLNPCLHSKLQIFSPLKDLPFNGKKYALDSCLNVNGFPQSATGQTTIYTGKNAAKQIGKHLFGFPNEKLKELLVNHSIFRKLESSGNRCKFINAFRPVFFTSPELFANIRLSATSEMNRAGGLPFNSLKDIKNKKALYHDFTNSEIIEKGFNLKEYDYENASSILIEQSKENDLILYEYFLTDKAGHSKDMNYAIDEINKIESLIYSVAKKMNGKNISLIVCSDHGNIEDIQTKSHTLNPAFFAVWTNKNVKSLTSLLDIYPLIVDLVEEKKPILK